MKRTTLPLLLATALLGQVANAQTSSSTPVIGYYKFDVPSGTSIWSAGFVTAKAFQGAMTSMTPGPQSVIHQSGATFPAFPLHYVEILSGPQAGTILDVVSNNATSITVDAQLGAGGLGLTGNETYCVRRHNTLGTVLQNGGGLTAGSDTVTIYNETGGVTYSFNGTNWEDADLNDAGDAIIYPGQAFIITNSDAATDTLTIGGNEVSYVKSGPTKVSLYPGVPNLVGLVNPLVGTETNPLGNYGFVQSLVAGSDTVELYTLNGQFTSVGVYQSNGTNMEDGDLNDASAVPVRNGAGLVVGVALDGIYTAPALHPN